MPESAVSPLIKMHEIIQLNELEDKAIPDTSILLKVEQKFWLT
jgi:hypothetical protein